MIKPETLSGNPENPSVLYFVDHYDCPDAMIISNPTCSGYADGDGGVAIVDSQGSSILDYGAAFSVAAEHAPNCPHCQKKMIPQLVSKKQK